MAITEQQVHAACERLDAAGQKPSAERIREALGNIGSYTTIQRYLGTYKGSHDPPAPDIPPEVERDVQASAQVLWRGAVRIAREAHQAEREALLRRIADLTRAVTYTEADVVAREEERDAALRHIAELDVRCTSLENQLRRGEAELATTLGRLQAYQDLLGASRPAERASAASPAPAQTASGPRNRAARVAGAYQEAVSVGDQLLGEAADEL